MTYVPYSYKHVASRRYVFTSVGKSEIKKVVEFVPLKAKNVMKILATLVYILKHYTTQHPEITVFFTGSTKDRTKLYTRIIRTYYSLFTEEFVLYGIIGTDGDNETILFNTEAELEYVAFLIKRIN